ncbi:MAG: GNAT family N-acetyltransferase [Raineya sp.]|jgi:RimJ/RimL family protein N-acetyltransferase|nr:GNAT family N-acetyltransferase [Raineya sp.]
MLLDFNETYILENEKIRLEPLQLSHLEHLKHFAIQEPEIWKYSLMQINGVESLQKYIQIALENKNSKKEYPFAVFDKVRNLYAGSTRFYDIQLENRMLQLGFTWYGKDFQGTYVNRNCKYLLLEFAFEQLNNERVEFRADYRNEKSIQAMIKIGCTKEGVLRNHADCADGTRRTSVVLSILKDEWYQSVKNHLINYLQKYD